MATESPMRMIETTAAREWPSSKEGGAFGAPLNSLAAEELGLLMRSHKLPENQAETILSRSGSAPPSIEGSFAAMRNLIAQQNTRMDSDLGNISSAIENCEFEEKMRSDPAYLAYYCSNIKINPRLPPPLISRENQRLVRHINAFGNNRKLNSLDGSGDGSLQAPQYSLSTHKEEPEDNRLPQECPDNQSEEASMSGQDTSLSARHKSLVDLIQEDFPRTPSPVYSLSRSSVHATEESADHDVNVASLDISSLSISKEPEPSPSPVIVSEETSSHVANDTKLVPNDGPQSTFIQSSSPLEVMGNTSVLHGETSREKDLALKDDTSTDGSFGMDISNMDSRIKPTGEKSYRNKREEREPYTRSVPPRHSNMQRGVYSQDQGGQGHAVYQGVNHPHNDTNNLSYSQSALSIEGHSAMHYSGLAPPLYATAAAYMSSGSPLYPNFQPFSPPYSLGFLSSTLIPPYMAGYPTHAATNTNMPIDANPGPSVGNRVTTVSTGESIPHSGGFQNMNSFYGQPGLVLQPPYVDPLHMQYVHNLYGDMYGSSSQSGYRSGVGSQEASFVSHRNPANASYFIEQKTQSPTNECIPIPDPTKVGMSVGRYYGNPSMGIVTQFPASHASPVLPSGPAGGTSNFGRRSELWSPQSPNRSFGGYPGWQGQRGAINVENSKRHSILEELKSGNARRFEISDIVGHIVDFSADQHGSRFIQQKLESSDGGEKKIVFKEILPHAARLMTDVFGNYVIQKLFEHGSPEQRAELADQLVGQILNLSLQMYGCRVIQKALEVIELDQKIRLVSELDGHVMRCVRDQNGNHVIQKCIECVPADRIGFIISEFHGQVATLSTHPYGCRVIQRILEHCTDEQLSQCIVDEILESAFVLAQDQYGNYVTQHVLERGKAHERRQIVSKLAGKVVQMSQHKYASNVVEKCFLYGDASEQESMINEILGKSEENDHLLVMMKDQYANYVVQKILETCGERHRATLLGCIRVHLNSLKKYTYGKHIVARYEQLFGEAGQASET